MRPPSNPPGHSHYTVRVLKSVPQPIMVLCPICHDGFEIKKYGIVKCPNCGSKLEYKQIKRIKDEIFTNRS